MKVQTYINEGPGALWKYRPGDRLVKGPIVEVFADGAGDEGTAERVWEVGNRIQPGVDGQWWPRDVRSISMGDVIVIGEVAWTAVSIGWEPIDTGDLLRSLDPEQSTRHPEIEAREWARA